MKLWLDDERDPKDPYIQKNFNATPDMIWVKTVEEAIVLINSGNVESISFDHDLGLNQKTGYDLAKYIEEGAHKGTINAMNFFVHSQNPIGCKYIKAALRSAKRAWRQL